MRGHFHVALRADRIMSQRQKSSAPCFIHDDSTILPAPSGYRTMGPREHPIHQHAGRLPICILCSCPALESSGCRLPVA